MAVTMLQFEPLGSRLNELRLSGKIKIPLGATEVRMIPISTPELVADPAFKIGMTREISPDGINWTGVINSGNIEGDPRMVSPHAEGLEAGEIVADTTVNWNIVFSEVDSQWFGIDGVSTQGQFIRVGVIPLAGNPSGGIPIAVVIEAVGDQGQVVPFDVSTRG